MSNRVIRYIIDVEDKFSKTFDQLEERFKTIDKLSRLGDIGKQLEKTGRSLTRSGRLLSLYVTAPLALMGTAAYKASENLYDLELQYGRILKNKEEGAKLLNTFKATASNLPFSLSDLGAASVDLLASRGNTPEKMIATLQQLGDVAAATKMDIKDLASIYRNAMIFGRLDTTTLNALEKGNVPIIEALQRILKTDASSKLKGVDLTPQDIKTLVAGNRIPATVLDKVLKDLTSSGGIYEGAAKQLSEGPKGIIERLNQARENIFASLGGAIFRDKEIVQGLKELSVWVDKIAVKIENWTKKNPELVKTLAKIVAVVATLGPALLALGGTIYAISQVTLALKALLIVLRAMTLTPIGLTITAIGVALWGVYDAIDALNTGGTEELFKRWEDRLSKITGFFASITRYVHDLTNIGGIGDKFNAMVGVDSSTGKTADNSIAGAYQKSAMSMSFFEWVKSISMITKGLNSTTGTNSTSLALQKEANAMRGDVSILIRDPGNNVSSINTQTPLLGGFDLGVNLQKG